MLFGLESDTLLAEYLYRVIKAAMANELSRFKHSTTYRFPNGMHRKSLSTSFLKGMAARIHYRLKDMKEERHREEEKVSVASTGYSLVVVKQNKVDDEFEELNMKLRSAGNMNNWRYNSDAYSAGQLAGERVNLNRPLAGKVMGLLT